MTVSLFDVDDALESEDKLLERIQKALDWKLRAKERGEAELEEVTETLEASSPEEAPKSSSPA